MNRRRRRRRRRREVEVEVDVERERGKNLLALSHFLFSREEKRGESRKEFMGASPGKHDVAQRPRRPRAMMAASSSSLSSSSPPKMMEDAHELSVGEVRLDSMAHRAKKKKKIIDRRAHWFSSPFRSDGARRSSLFLLHCPSSSEASSGELKI